MFTLPESETVVWLLVWNVAVSLGNVGTVIGVQFEAEFQLLEGGLADQVALAAKLLWLLRKKTAADRSGTTIDSFELHDVFIGVGLSELRQTYHARSVKSPFFRALQRSH
jgi:hypothetical protein